MSTDLATTTLRDLLDDSDKAASDNSSLHRLELEWGPIEHLAYYSCDESDKVTFDPSCLHKFNQPSSLRLPVDLSRGRELFHTRNKHNRTLGHPIPLDNLARACVKLGKEKELRGADVVSWRGVLVK